MLSLSELFGRIEEDVYWAVVQAFDGHVGGELSFGQRDSLLAYLPGQLLDEGLGFGWFCGGGEAGTSALAGIAVESEVAYQEDLASGLEEIQIKTSVFIVEYSQAGDFSPQILAILGGVFLGYAEIDEQSRSNLGEGLIIDAESSKFDSLGYSAHQVGFLASQQIACFCDEGNFVRRIQRA